LPIAPKYPSNQYKKLGRILTRPKLSDFNQKLRTGMMGVYHQKTIPSQSKERLVGELPTLSRDQAKHFIFKKKMTHDDVLVKKPLEDKNNSSLVRRHFPKISDCKFGTPATPMKTQVSSSQVLQQSEGIQSARHQETDQEFGMPHEAIKTSSRQHQEKTPQPKINPIHAFWIPKGFSSQRFRPMETERSLRGPTLHTPITDRNMSPLKNVAAIPRFVNRVDAKNQQSKKKQPVFKRMGLGKPFGAILNPPKALIPTSSLGWKDFSERLRLT
jgi:hypothetical protein